MPVEECRTIEATSIFNMVYDFTQRKDYKVQTTVQQTGKTIEHWFSKSANHQSVEQAECQDLEQSPASSSSLLHSQSADHVDTTWTCSSSVSLHEDRDDTTDNHDESDIDMYHYSYSSSSEEETIHAAEMQVVQNNLIILTYSHLVHVTWLRTQNSMLKCIKHYHSPVCLPSGMKKSIPLQSRM